MIVVVVIIGILAGVLVPRLVGARERASDSGRMVKVSQISSAVELYAQEIGSPYPIATLTGAPWTSIATPSVTNAIAPYLSTIPTDPGKWTVAILGLPGNIQVTGDSFAYWTNTGWTVYAITALMESKKGNTTNATEVIDSDKQGWYQKVGKWLIYSYALWGKAPLGITQFWTDLVVSDGTNTYTIMDRNIWASAPGTGSASYGSFFQRGNNYGFPSDPSANITTSITKVNVSTYEPNQYNSGTFIRVSGNPTDWAIPTNHNIRPEKTQWPCFNWYHVPTQQERQWLITTRKNIYMTTNNNWNLLGNTLLLPLVGNRSRDYATNYGQWRHGYYWSSTPNTASYGKTSYFMVFYLPSIDNGIYISSTERSMGMSIRCFKN